MGIQVEPECVISASLWFAKDPEEGEEYRWREVAYFAGGKVRKHEPFSLDFRDADMAMA